MDQTGGHGAARISPATSFGGDRSSAGRGEGATVHGRGRCWTRSAPGSSVSTETRSKMGGGDCGVGSGERSGGRSSAPSERGVAMHKGAGWASEGHREEALTRPCSRASRGARSWARGGRGRRRRPERRRPELRVRAARGCSLQMNKLGGWEASAGRVELVQVLFMVSRGR